MSTSSSVVDATRVPQCIRVTEADTKNANHFVRCVEARDGLLAFKCLLSDLNVSFFFSCPHFFSLLCGMDRCSVLKSISANALFPSSLAPV